MKTILRSATAKALFLLFALVFTASFVRAQCVLQKGDIIFTGYDLTDNGSNGAGGDADDRFSFAILRDIPAGTQIGFTDLGWTSANAFQTTAKAKSDGVIRWTADVAYPAGTEVTISCKYLLTANKGTVAGVLATYETSVEFASDPDQYMNLAELSGDQLFAFTGTYNSNPALLAGLSVNTPAGWVTTLDPVETTSANSQMPAVLASGAQNLSVTRINADDADFTNAYSARIATLGTTNGLPAIIAAANTVANWELTDPDNAYTSFEPLAAGNTYSPGAPAITTQPADRLNMAPTISTTFSVVADATACSYQWQVQAAGTNTWVNVTNTAPYTNATTATLNLSSVNGLDGTLYRVIVYGAIAVTSNAAVLRVPPVVTAVGVPVNKTYKAGEDLFFLINFNKPVSIVGAVALNLTIGTASKSASLIGTISSTSYNFKYTVAANDLDLDGIQVTSLNVPAGAFIASNYGTEANHALAGVNSTAGVLVDAMPPTLTFAGISSDNPNSAYAKTGDHITLNLTADEAIVTPVVTIAGHPANVTGSGTTYVATYTMGAADTEGPVNFTADFKDLYDNVATQVTGTTNSSSVTLDNTAPTVSINSPSVASIGAGSGDVTYTVTYSDTYFGSATLSTGDITVNPTGTATGTATVSGSGTSYTVTISNIAGSGTLGISAGPNTATDNAGNLVPAAGPSATFAVLSADATLSGLTTTAANFSPVFNAGTFSYTASVANTTATTTVTPTITNANATMQVRINGGSYADLGSGIPSEALALNEGDNAIDVKVTAEDGTTAKTYTITVNRAASADLAIVVTNTPEPLQYNGTLTVTSVITNNGPGAAVNMNFHMRVPSAMDLSSIDFAVLPSGWSGSYSTTSGELSLTDDNPAGLASGSSALISMTFTPASGASGSIPFTATISSSTADTDPTNNSYTTNTTIIGQTAITFGTPTGTIVTCENTVSSDPNLISFTVNGTNLTADITATAPAGFELSASATGTYSNTVTLPQSGGSVNEAAVYVRAAAQSANIITRSVTLSSAGAADLFVAVTATISPNPTVANAGQNQGTITNTVTLAGNIPAVGTGAWTQTGGPAANITDPGAYNTTVTGIDANGDYTFTWTISTSGGCNISADDVVITKADAPVLTYVASKIFNVNTQATLTPTSSTVNGFTHSPRYVLGQSPLISSPSGIAVNSTGTVYVVNNLAGSGLVQSIPAGFSYSSDLNTPFNMATDPAGNIYVADIGLDHIVKITPAGVSTNIGSVFIPTGVAADAAGNVYISQFGAQDVVKVATDGTQTELINGINSSYAVAVDGQGNVYAVDNFTNAVYKLSAGATTPVAESSLPVAMHVTKPTSVWVDLSGNIYTANNDNSITVQLTDGLQFVLENSAAASFGVTADNIGNVYASDNGASKVYNYKPTGGYYISPMLPAGLVFNSNTGAISGLPTATNPATDYTITGWNNGGYVTTTINIAVEPSTSITAFTRADATPSNAATVNYNLTFADPVTGLTASNFSISTTGSLSGVSVGTPTGSGTSWVVPVTTGSGDGTIVLFLADNTGLSIPLTNTLPYLGPLYTVIKTQPGIVISSTATDPTSTSPIPVKFSFDQLVSGFDASDINTTGGTLAGLTGEFTISALTPFGTAGSGNGEFNTPNHLALDGDGNIYVTDKNNHRISIFGNDGTFIQNFGTPGSGDGQFNGPSSVAVDANANIYVVDQTNSRVQVFNYLTTYVRQFTVSSTGGQPPYAIALDNIGNIYVSFEGGTEINKYDNTGALLNTIGTSGSANGQFAGTYGIAVDAANNLYVNDFGNSRVQIFDNTGTYIRGFDGEGNQINTADGIAVDRSGNVYIAENGGGRVSVFNDQGIRIATSAGGLNGAAGIAVNNLGKIYVAENGGNDIQVFNLNQDYTANITPTAGTINVNVAANVANNSYNNGNTQATQFTIQYNTSVSGIAAIPPVTTNASVVNYTVTFAAPVTGLTANNFSLTGTITNGTIETPATDDGGTTWTVPVNTGTGSGTIILNLVNADNLSPGLSNTVPFIGDTYTIDREQPVITSVAAPSNGNYGLNSPIEFTVTFSKPVTVTGTPFLDVTLASGTVNAVYAGGSGSTLTFTYTVANGDLDQDGIQLAASLLLNGGTIQDAVGNNAAIALNNTAPTTGILVDGVVPTAIALVRTDANPTNASNVDYTITFSEPVNNVTAGNFTLLPTATASGTITGVSGAGTTWTVNISLVSGDGTLQLNLNNSGTSIIDNAGNPISGGASGEIYTIDHTDPEASSGIYTSNNTNNVVYAKVGDVITLRFNISETLQTPAITLAGHSVIPTFDGSRWTASYTMDASDTEGNADFDLTITDLAGNTTNYSSATTGLTIIFQNTAPNANPLVFRSDNVNPLIAVAGNTVTLNFTTDKQIQDPVVTIAGQAITAINTGGNDWIASYIASVSTARGRIPFTLSITDIAGNTQVYDDVAAGDNIQFKDSNATLSTLAVSAGTLSPVFVSTTKSYNVSVPNNIDNIEITPTSTVIFASIMVNNLPATSGSAFGPIALNVGDNVIPVTVTAEDGVTTETYNITVNRDKAAQVITFNPISSRTYGDVDFDPGAVSDNPAIPVTYTSSNPAVATIVDGKVHIVGVGSANIIASQDGDETHYPANNLNSTQSLLVEAATLTITAEGKTAIYGDPFPELTANYSGFVNNEDQSIITTWPVLSPGATMSSPVGDYLISASGATAPNYTIVYQTGNLHIGQRAISVTADLQSKVYGDGDPALTYQITAGSLVALGDLTGLLTRDPGENVGSYAITQGGLTANSNYSLTFNGANLAIGQRAITVTADAQSKVYGDGDPALTYQVTSGTLIARGDLTGLLTRDPGENVGSYVITQGGLTANSNYNLTFNGANLAIGQRAITVTADAQTKTYGDADPALTYTFSPALVAGDSWTGALTRDPGENTGSYTITQGTLALNANYNLSYTAANLTIGKAALVITADNKTRIQANPNPAFTFSYSGFVNRETSTVLTTQPTGATVADAASLPADYPITVSGATADNYTISYVNGTLTVSPGTATDIIFSQATLLENSQGGALAGTLAAVSPNPNATYTYTLISGAGDTDNALFTLSGSEIATLSSLNYENKANYSIRVRATNQNDLTFDKVITIALTDVNEAPTLGVIANVILCNIQAAQSITLAGITAGPDANQTTQVTATNSNAAMFDSFTVTNGAINYRIKAGVAGTAVIAVTVKDNGGTANNGNDTFVQAFTITVNALPAISIASNAGIEISKGAATTLTASGGTSYVWTGAGIVSGQNTSALAVRPSVTTTYTVTVTNAAGCTATQSITITVVEDYKTIEGTNILSPNGDGVNDQFIVDNIDMYPNNTLKIFDIAGKLIYTKVKYDNTWEGTLNGVALTEGTYYYVIDFGEGKMTKKGFITIVRQ